jgi:hypothetical protein
LTQVVIPSDATEQITEYLDHNELGLGFETLVEALAELEGRPPPAVMQSLREANERMGNPPDGREAGSV